MRLKVYETFTKTRGEVYYLVPLGDIHAGTKNCNEGQLVETINWIYKKPNARWIGMGDYAECINYTDKRFDPHNISPRFQDKLDNLHYEQIRFIGDLFKPIAEKCIGLLEGNHEESIRLRYHTNVVDLLAHKLKTENLSYTSLIKWRFNRLKARECLTIYAVHGWGGGRQVGSKVNNIVNVGKDFDADIYLAGHTHEKVSLEREQLAMVGEDENPRLVARKKIYGVTGTFYKTYEVGAKSYSEKMGYPPTPTGALKIQIEPFQQKKVEGKSVSQPIKMHIEDCF